MTTPCFSDPSDLSPPEGKRIRPSSSFRLRSPSLNSVRLRRIFDAFDKNGDGQITVEELGSAMERLGLLIPLPDLESMVGDFFPAGGDSLDFDGFAALHNSVGEQLFGYGTLTTEGVNGEEQEEELREAFRVFDEDGDGFISAEELTSVLTRLGLADEGNVEQMIYSVDQNSDGLVDFVEFKHMMTQTLTTRSS